MNCEEVKISLHNFFDGLLDDFTRHNVEMHLRTCEKCYSEYKRLKIFFDLVKDLPNFSEPPADIIQKFSYELMKKSHKSMIQEENSNPVNTRKVKKELKKQEKRLKQKLTETKKSRASQVMSLPANIKSGLKQQRFNRVKFILSLMPLVLIAIGYYLYDFQKYNSPWEVKNVTGEILINGFSAQAFSFSQGESFISQNKSSATITVPKVGNIFVDENTSLFLEKAKDGGNRLKLNSGKIRVTNTVDLPDFIIVYKGYEIKDKNGEFSVSATDSGRASVSVNSGFVEIIHNEQSNYLNESYVCDIIDGFDPGTPFNIYASDSLKNEIKNFDYNNGGDASVDKIISLAKPKDMLTLLAMIPHASQLKRQVLYQVITNQFPPPENVTRMGIIKGDPKMLFLWWQEIQWQL